MTTYNYNAPSWLRGQIAQLFTLVQQRSYVRRLMGSINIPASPELKEVQGSILMSRPNSHVGKTLGSHLTTGGLYEVETKFTTWWVWTDVGIKKTLYDSQAPIAIPANIQREFSGYHNLVLDESMAISSASELSGWPGFLDQSAGNTVYDPDDCCSTPGTAETGSSWVGGQATAMAFVTDLVTLLNDIIGKEDSYGRGIVTYGDDGLPSGNFQLLIHPNAFQHLRKPVYNGSYYLDTTYEKYITQNLGLPISYWRFAATGNSSAYTGAEDATTVLWMVYNPKENFFMGTIKDLGWDSNWGEWLSDDHLQVKNRMLEKVTGFIRPYDIDGTQYKALSSSTITPWNNAA